MSSQPNQSTALSVYMKRPDVLIKFTDLLGDSGKSYVQSVLIAVAGSNDLTECTNESVFRSALRAASLGLSCDPALKQAWLVPYNRKVKARKVMRDGKETVIPEHWEKEAQFQPHYKGLYTLAMRTGKYWQINVSPVYEGQRVLENTLTGLHAVRDEGSSVVGKPDSFNAAYTDVTVRRKNAMKVIGWIGYFKTKKGFEKSVYMSIAEIDDHARKYVKDYDKNPNWNDAEKRPVMEMKTVLRQLLSWADMSGTENAQLAEALQAEEEIIEGTSETVPELAAQSTDMTIEQARAETIFLVSTGKDEPIGDLPLDALNKICINDMLDEKKREAARLVLKVDFNAEPPEAEKKSPEQIQKELGF